MVRICIRDCFGHLPPLVNSVMEDLALKESLNIRCERDAADSWQTSQPHAVEP